MIVKFGTRPEYDLEETECKTVKEANRWIRKMASKHNIKKAPYVRCNFSVKDDFIEIDIGSWSYFGYIKNLTDENWKEFLEPNKLSEVI